MPFILACAIASAQPSGTIRPGAMNPGGSMPGVNRSYPNGATPMRTPISTGAGDTVATAAKKPNTAPSAVTKPSSGPLRIGLILPFDAQASSEDLYASMRDREGLNTDNSLKESTQQALDFYEGIKYAITTDSLKSPVSFYVFDSRNSDSLVEELLKDDSLRSCDLIIGPTNSAQAKTVAAFCKKYKIFNIQPFVASKAFSTDNPYLVRFMPTIDAHLQMEYEMVIDSFSDANIIVFTTKKERDLSAARQLDTLFKSYNAINTHKLRYTFLNSGDSSMPAAKRALSFHLLPKERNVVMMTCYDEPVVNSQLRTLKDNVTVFGMPTWIDAEQIRIDYLNKSQCYFTDCYYVDTANARVSDFITGYSQTNNQKPSRYSYLGYDAMKYLTKIASKYRKNLKSGFDNESYDGLGFSFHISPVIHMAKASGEPIVNYYTNTAMHLFQVSDYKVWLVK